MISLSRESEIIARRLAEMQNVTIDDAIRQALEARASVAGIVPEARRPYEQSPAEAAARRARLAQHVEAIAALPILDPRSPADIVDDLNAV